LDLGIAGGAMATIRKRQFELSEGVGVILFDDNGDEWVLIDAVVDRFNPQRDSWIVRLDWSTYRDIGKARGTNIARARHHRSVRVQRSTTTGLDAGSDAGARDKS
jgi:hypothetical protein